MYIVTDWQIAARSYNFIITVRRRLAGTLYLSVVHNIIFYFLMPISKMYPEHVDRRFECFDL